VEGRVDTQVVIYLTEHDVSSHQSRGFQAVPRHVPARQVDRYLAFNSHSADSRQATSRSERTVYWTRDGGQSTDTPVSHTTFTRLFADDDAGYLYFGASDRQH